MHDLLPGPSRVPVTLLTSGSLPTLRRLLDRYARHGESCRIVLIQESDERAGTPASIKQYRALPADGVCICCTLRGDPVRLLAELADHRRHGTLLFDEVMIHPSLTADPACLVRKLIEAEPLSAIYYLENPATCTLANRWPDRSSDTQDTAYGSPAERAAAALIDRLRVASGPAAAQNRSNEKSSPGGDDPDRPAAGEISPVGSSLLDKPASGPEIGSFVFRSEAPFHFQRLGKFMASVLQVYGNDLLRYKGTLQFAGCPYRVSVWGSRLLMGSEAGAAWREDEQKESCLIFVGRRLPREVLVDGLPQCLDDPQANWRTA